MRKADKVNYLIEPLDERFPETPIPLHHRDNYSLLIAVPLAAQYTDERVNHVTPALFARADNPYDMVKMSVEEIAALVRPCGLAPMKSKGIHDLSQILIEKRGGQVPADMDVLEALPAVGHKIASVVISQGFGQPAFPADTHIHRLMYRWGLSNGHSVVQTECDAKRLFPREKWNKLQPQIIYYARAYSPARGWDLHRDYISQKIGPRALLRKTFSQFALPAQK